MLYTLDLAILLDWLPNYAALQGQALQCYLSDHYNFVHLNAELSKLTAVNFDLPKGFVLGSLLFSIFGTCCPLTLLLKSMWLVSIAMMTISTELSKGHYGHKPKPRPRGPCTLEDEAREINFHITLLLYSFCRALLWPTHMEVHTQNSVWIYKYEHSLSVG